MLLWIAAFAVLFLAPAHNADAECTCVEGFEYFTEISNESHYDYTGFPYLE